jgi:hypothetical protein
MNLQPLAKPNSEAAIQSHSFIYCNCSAIEIDRRRSKIDVICYDINWPTRGQHSNGRTRNHVSLPGFVVPRAVSLRALSVQGASTERFCSSQQSRVHVSGRTPIRIPLPHANRMYEHALGRGSTGFRVPRANSTRLQPCRRHSAL